MSNLDNLINKIINDAQDNANTIINEAKEKADSIVNKKIDEAEKDKEVIIEKGKIEAATKKERIISNAKLKVRNQILSAKQEIINEIYDEVLNCLINLSQEQFLRFVEKSIKELPIDGDEELIVNNDDKAKINEEFINKLNQSLISLNKKGKIKLSQENRDIKGGFILQKNGVELNNSFESLVDSCKDVMETEIVNILF